MEYRQFGKTDLKVSAIGFGCWEVGGTYGRIDEANSTAPSHRAIDSGITCFDTAEAYGMGVSEEALAEALGPRRNDVVDRHQIRRRLRGNAEPPRQQPRPRAGLDRQEPAAAAHRPCRYLSRPLAGPQQPLDETMRALDDIVRQGKVRYVGVSNFRLAQIEECMRLRRIDVVQYAWNMFDRRMQAEIFPYCARAEIGVMAYGSLAYGMLSGTFHGGM